MVRLKCSVFTSYVRAPATFFPAQQDRVQVARAERRWNTIVEHGITNVGVSNNARSTVVAATGELEIQGGSARCTVLNRWCIDISLSVQRRFLFFSSSPRTVKRGFRGRIPGRDSEMAIVRLFTVFHGTTRVTNGFTNRLFERRWQCSQSRSLCCTFLDWAVYRGGFVRLIVRCWRRRLLLYSVIASVFQTFWSILIFMETL